MDRKGPGRDQVGTRKGPGRDQEWTRNSQFLDTKTEPASLDCDMKSVSGKKL